jgi:hypothetical protein
VHFYWLICAYEYGSHWPVSITDSNAQSKHSFLPKIKKTNDYATITLLKYSKSIIVQLSGENYVAPALATILEIFENSVTLFNHS